MQDVASLFWATWEGFGTACLIGWKKRFIVQICVRRGFKRLRPAGVPRFDTAWWRLRKACPWFHGTAHDSQQAGSMNDTLSSWFILCMPLFVVRSLLFSCCPIMLVHVWQSDVGWQCAFTFPSRQGHIINMPSGTLSTTSQIQSTQISYIQV